MFTTVSKLAIRTRLAGKTTFIPSVHGLKGFTEGAL